MVVELIKTQVAYLKSNWKQMGRPTFPIPILHSMLGMLMHAQPLAFTAWPGII